MRWRRFAVLVLLAAAASGGAGAAVTMLRSGGDAIPGRGTLVHLGLPATLGDYPAQPFCVDAQHFCIVQSEMGQLKAVYTYDPHAHFREQRCEVRWHADAAMEKDSVTIHGLFRDPCGGSAYDSSGRRVFGPTPRDFDTFPVEVTDAETIVDTRMLICGKQRGAPTYDCPRAPLGN